MIARLHERVAGVLGRTGALDAVMELRRFGPGSTISIVTFHHIQDIADDTYRYDPDVVDATPAQLRRHLETLARIGTPIGIDTLIAALDGASLPPNPVMITFDDGYRSCHDVAFPLLRALGIPATFFIATAFVSERRLYWWERIALVLRLAGTRTAHLAYPTAMAIDTRDRTLRQRLDRLVKDTRGLDLDRFTSELSTALDVEWSPAIEAAHANELILTWDQIRALANAGMDVESHTRRHRVLQTLDSEQLRDELVGSRSELEHQLGRPVRAIAYPVGHRLPTDHRIRAAVAAAGYRIGLSNHTGVNRMWMPGVFDPFDLRRQSTDRSMSDAMFLTQLAIPALAYTGR